MENLEIKDKITQLQSFLPEKSKEELEQILAYGEKIKERGKKEKKKFWSNADRHIFLKLLNYRLKHQKEIESEYMYLDKMTGIERKKFIREYLYDDILYHGKLDKEELRFNYFSYEDWKNGNVKVLCGDRLDFDFDNLGDEGVKEIAKILRLEEGVDLSLNDSEIGDGGAKALAENMELKEGVNLWLSDNQIGDEGVMSIAENMKLKEGVVLELCNNRIGYEGAKVIAKNMELKEGVQLDLGGNKIGDEGAKAVAEMELKEGVTICLYNNGIGDEGAKAIMEKMELKRGVRLDLQNNLISDDIKDKLKKWEKSYGDMGIKCNVLVD